MNPAGDLPQIVIMGAGPAGCAAAIMARLAGLRVLVLERRISVRRLPGETLHPGIEPILRALGVWSAVSERGFHRHHGIWREGVDGRRSFEKYGGDADGPWRGFQVNRRELQQILWGRVTELGGVIERVHQGKLVSANASLVVAVNGRQVAAPYFLDATGRQRWLAGELDIATETRGPMQRVRHGWAPRVEKHLEGEPLFRQRVDGWDWLAQVENGETAWAELRRGAGARGIDYTWRHVPACAGPGYFLLGDAACLMDPSTANGVLRAMMSGMLTAQLASAVLQQGADAEAAAAHYREWVHRLFEETWAATGRFSQPLPREK